MTHEMTHSEYTQAITDLEQEAAQAGDSSMVRDCQRAVRPKGYGYKASRARCIAAIDAARNECQCRRDHSGNPNARE
jgi:hypothetical protein